MSVELSSFSPPIGVVVMVDVTQEKTVLGLVNDEAYVAAHAN